MAKPYVTLSNNNIEDKGPNMKIHNVRYIPSRFSLLCLMVLLITTQVIFAQKKIILDTDPAYDPDDAGCMAMLHGMANEGEVEILAIMNVFNHRESPLAISAINFYYNRRAIPVGDYKGWKNNASTNTYDHYLAHQYPRDLSSDKEAPEAYKLYREILAGCLDKTVTIIVVGTLHNIEALLKSRSDVYSRLSGRELVSRKVAEIVSMGGNFIDGSGNDRTNWGGSNALCSIATWACLNSERNALSRYVIDHCPVPFIASGWENGNGMFAGAKQGDVRAGQRLKEKPADNITRRAYEFHFQSRGGSHKIDRHTNDQNALLYAVRGVQDYYDLFNNGDITLTTDGACQWTQYPNHGGGYVKKKMSNTNLAKVIEDLMLRDPMTPDNSPPDAPQGLSSTKNGSTITLSWDRAKDPTPGSWVVAYNIYRNDFMIGKAYGTRFTDKSRKKGTIIYEVSAINVNARESRKSRIEVTM